MKKQVLFNRSSDQKMSNTLPLNIGVTGHRDLRHEDIQKLSKKVHEIFIKLQNKYPDTLFILFSPLAEGADRLAAEVALEMGCRLVVPLPFEQEEFEKDFPDEGSREDFRRLLKQADGSFVLPLAEGCALESIRGSGKCRDRQYDQASAYIVGNCPVIIALWDGDEKSYPAKVVKWHLFGLPESNESSFLRPEPVEEKTIYHVVTPRISNPYPPDAFLIKLPSRAEKTNGE